MGEEQVVQTALTWGDTSERKNRQFFVSTTTISTTLSTQSFCFDQSNTVSMMLLCAFSRKKRTLDWGVFDKKNLGIDASPSLKEGKFSVAQEELDPWRRSLKLSLRPLSARRSSS